VKTDLFLGDANTPRADSSVSLGVAVLPLMILRWTRRKMISIFIEQMLSQPVERPTSATKSSFVRQDFLHALNFRF
jgi:hypothetical protein